MSRLLPTLRANAPHALACTVLVLASACAQPRETAAHRDRLAQAATRLEASDYRGSAWAMEALLREESGDDAPAELQRFFALALLTSAHAQAALQDPFAEQPAPPDGAFALDDASAPAKPSPVAHLVAAIHYANYARELYPAVRTVEASAAESSALPAELSSFGVRNAMARVHLTTLAAYGRLGFQDRVDAVVDALPELATLEGCERMLEQARVAACLKPWVYRGLFERQRRADEPRAFQFAARALETAPDAAEFDARARAELAEWITRGSRYVFKCPQCKTQVDPALNVCAVCRRPNAEFEAELAPTGR